MNSKRRLTINPAHGNRSSAVWDSGDDIPEFMLLEVFMRLPLKDLFKCKIVSKQWCSIICCAFMARTYVDHRLSLTSQDWILISCYAKKVTTDQFFQKKLQELDRSPLGMINSSLDLLLLPRDDGQLIDDSLLLVGVSNGLLLYGPRVEFASRRQIYSYEICNPITGQKITLPPSHRCFQFVATGFVTLVEDNVLKSYRVVRAEVHSVNPNSTRLDVYSSEARKWEYFSVGMLIYLHKWKHPVVVGRTTLHWMIDKHSVMAFDPYNITRSVRLSRLPTHDVASYVQSKLEHELDSVLFDEYQGRLRYVELKLDPQQIDQPWTDLSIWILNDYDGARWCLQHRVHISIVAVPVSFHPFLPSIIYLKPEQALLSYDVRTGELKVVDDSKRCYVYDLPYGHQYFSFIIPPWPIFFPPEAIH